MESSISLIRVSDFSIGHEVATGARVPLEEQPKPEDSSDEPSEEENEEEEDPEKSTLTELGMHMDTINKILADLYKLSFRIRNTAARPKSLKPALYKEIDDETGIDKFTIYAQFDRRHVEESFIQLRRDAAKEMPKDISKASEIRDKDHYLIDRLVATITKRRKVLRYWQRHAKKLAEVPEEAKEVVQALPKPTIPVATAPKLDVQSIVKKSSVTEKTILSKTEVTKYDKKPDDMIETQSVISYASTSFDAHGNHVDLPPPPAVGSKGSEFLCPYCGIVYSASHGRGRAWRTHIIQDLQPYICTYPNCPDGLRIYGSRTAWLEHERLVHRRVWQCFEHAEPLFAFQDELRNHLESEHCKDVTETQILNLLDVSESSVADARTKCPICLLEGPFSKGMENHISFHLETFATFSISRGISTGDEDASGADGQSGKAQGLGSTDSPYSGPLHFESPPRSATDVDDEDVPEKAPLDENSDHLYNTYPNKIPVALRTREGSYNVELKTDIDPLGEERFDKSEDQASICEDAAVDKFEQPSKEPVEQVEVLDTGKDIWNLVTDKFTRAREGHSERAPMAFLDGQVLPWIHYNFTVGLECKSKV